MRTNIEIDDTLMATVMKGGQFKTKREAVEEGLRLVARRNHALEVLKWEGKLHWDDQPDPATKTPALKTTRGASVKPNRQAAKSARPAPRSKTERAPA